MHNKKPIQFAAHCVKSWLLVVLTLVVVSTFSNISVAAQVTGCHNPTAPAGGGGAGGGDGGCSPSFVDNVMLEHHHYATDYEVTLPEKTSGCSSCAGTPAGPQGLEKGTALPALSLKRTHRPRVYFQHGAFGPGIFSNFDAQLSIEQTENGTQIFLFEPDNRSLEGTLFVEQDPSGGPDQQIDGALWPVTNNTYRFRTLELFGVESEPVSAPVEGGVAVATLPDGSQWSFEIVRTRSGGNDELRGRLIEQADRNGNAIWINYQFSADSSDASLGFDRDRLWNMSTVTDAYGRSMSFTYILQGGWNSWVVSQAQLPNGQTIQYEYSNEDILPLSRVLHPDGSISTFTHGEDDVAQQHAVQYDDAGSEDTHRRKTVYFTRAQFVQPGGAIVDQVPYLIRRAFNGSGELVYSNQESATDPTIVYAFMANQGYVRLQYSGDDFLLTEFATNWTLGGDPTTFTYEPHRDWLLGEFLRSGAAVDGLGRTTTFEYDRQSGKRSRVTYPDGTFETTTYNAFAEPLHFVSRTGRVTDRTYDSKGNLLTEKRGVGTTAESTWRYEYNARGQVTRALDPNYSSTTPDLHATSYLYDSRGFLVQKIEPADIAGGPRPTSSYVWDAAGRLTQTIGPSGQVLRYAYDARNRLVATTFGDNSTETRTYGVGTDANLLTQQTDRNANATRYTFDLSGRKATTTQAFGRPEAVTESCTFLAGTTLPVQCTNRGNARQYSYDARLRQTSETQHPNTLTALTIRTQHNANGLPISSEDPYGRKLYMVYDVNDRVVRKVQEQVPGGVAPSTDLTTLARIATPNPPYVIEDTTFNPDGDVIERKNGRGIATRLEYDAQARTTALIEAAGTTVSARTEHGYDPAGNLTRQTRPRQFNEGGTFQTAMTYTGRNLLAAVTEGSGTPAAASKTFAYTPSGKKLSETDFRGNATTFAYSSCCDRLTSERDPAGASTSYTYDSFGNILTTTDPNGNVTRRTFDALNRLITSTNGANETTTFSYDDNLTDGQGIDAQASRTAGLSLGAGAVGSGVTTTDPLGHARFDLRDGQGRQVRQIDGNDNANTIKFDVIVGGLLEVSATDALGHATRQRTDAGGHVRTAVDAESQVSTSTFDPAGNEVTTRDPNQTGKTCVFDGRNRTTSCTDTQGDTNSWAYDAENNQVTMQDGVGQSTTGTFDARNRKLTERDRIGGTTSFTFDADNRTTSMTDAQGSVTGYLFDSRGLLTRETLPAQQAGVPNVRNYSYDPGRRMVTRTDQTGLISTLVYDGANRLKERRYPDGKNDLYSYDTASRLTSAISGRYSTTVTRTYDNGDRLLTETQGIGGTNYLVSYGYDAANRKTRITYPDSSVINRAYTDRNLLLSAKVGTTLVASRAYDAGRRLTRTTFGNGLLEDRTYRADNLISTISTPGINQLGYQYDQNKRASQETNPLLPSEAMTYGYDFEDRLVNWKRGPVATPAQTQAWNLSLVGDWQSTARDGVSETRTHSPVHEITSLTKAGNPTVALTNDAKGNLVLTGAGQTLAWDVENRLASAGSAPGLAGGSYQYDALGRRLSKTTAGVTTRFVHDGDQVIAEYENGTLKRRYVYGTYIDEPLARLASTGTLYYHQNRLFSVMALSNQTGQLAERYGYTPYGKRRVVAPAGATLAASAVGNQVGFTGRYHDGETQLTYFRARYQDAELGRFVGRDPIAFADYSVRMGARLRSSGASVGLRTTPFAVGKLRYTFRGSLYEVAAIAGSMDPFGEAPGDPFTSPDDAAKDWGQTYNGHSVAEDTEYGSTIYKVTDPATGDSYYSYTPANTGSTGVNIPPAPGGTLAAGDIHSHQAYVDEQHSDVIPPEDQTGINDSAKASQTPGYVGYVATPSGTLLKYDPQSGEVYEVSSDLPSDPKDPNRRNDKSPSNTECKK